MNPAALAYWRTPIRSDCPPWQNAGRSFASPDNWTVSATRRNYPWDWWYSR